MAFLQGRIFIAPFLLRDKTLVYMHGLVPRSTPLNYLLRKGRDIKKKNNNNKGISNNNKTATKMTKARATTTV